MSVLILSWLPYFKRGQLPVSQHPAVVIFVIATNQHFTFRTASSICVYGCLCIPEMLKSVNNYLPSHVMTELLWKIIILHDIFPAWYRPYFHMLATLTSLYRLALQSIKFYCATNAHAKTPNTAHIYVCVLFVPQYFTMSKTTPITPKDTCLNIDSP